MNKRKTYLKIIRIALILLLFLSITLVAASEHQLVLSDGTKVYYKNSSVEVMIPDEYEMQDQYLRGAWVTPLAGSIPAYSTTSKYKQDILTMFEILDYYEINALIFHVRIMNDALYPSELNPQSSYMKTSEDLLSWVIEECHNRGIEFHAWLNPYRVNSSGVTDLSVVTARYAKYPQNPASDAANLLKNDAGGVILNPGLENVRDFIIDTCMEIVENYDVDAIHFDDYFYISDVNDNDLYEANNPLRLSKSDWRREQVNAFIQKLSKTMREYNAENNRYVQLGISPTGIYRNGNGEVTYDENGNAITNGSATGGQEHYESYLFSDTVKWINNEWIDYITPQSYWGFSHKTAGYADVMSWWNKVVAKKKVNLYSGMGIYMSETPGKNYSWGFDPDEAPNQILYAQTLENCLGTVFYSYNYLRNTYNGNVNTLYGKGLTTIKQEMFTNPAIIPEIKSMTCTPGKIDRINAIVSDDKTELSFNKVENTKFYVVYRSAGNLTYEPEEVYDIFGSKDDVVTFVDENTNGKKYNYGIRPLSMSNTLGEATEFINISFNVKFHDNQGNVISTQKVVYGQEAIAPNYNFGNEFVGWNKDFSYVTSDMDIYPRYKDSDFYVTFYDGDNNVLAVKTCKYNQTVEAPLCTKVGFVFDKWDKDFSVVTSDLEVYPIFKDKICKITFVDDNGNVILEYELKYGKKGYFPENQVKDGYIFVGWSETLDPVKDDVTVRPVFEREMLTVTIYSSIDNEIIEVLQVAKYDNVDLPEAKQIEGYRFLGYSGNIENIKFNTKVYANYEEIYFDLYFVDINGKIVESYTYFYGEEEYVPAPIEVEGYTFIKWDIDYKNLDVNVIKHTIKPIYEANQITITYLGINDEVLFIDTFNKNEEVVIRDKAPDVEGYRFISWDKEYDGSFTPQTFKAVYEQLKAKVTFVDNDNNVILEISKDEFENYPDAPLIEGYNFVKWDSEVNDSYEDQVIKPIYERAKFTVTYKYGDEIIATEEVFYGEDAKLECEIPEIDGYTFSRFSSDGKNITSDTVINLVYSVNTSCKGFSLINLLLSSALALVLLFFRKKH